MIKPRRREEREGRTESAYFSFFVFACLAVHLILRPISYYSDATGIEIAGGFSCPPTRKLSLCGTGILPVIE